MAIPSPGVTRLVDGLHQLLSVSVRAINSPSSMATVITRNPSIYVFLDRGSAAMPALLALDGFAMLLNTGYSRKPDSVRYVRYHQQ